MKIIELKDFLNKSKNYNGQEIDVLILEKQPIQQDSSIRGVLIHYRVNKFGKTIIGKAEFNYDSKLNESSLLYSKPNGHLVLHFLEVGNHFVVIKKLIDKLNLKTSFN